MSGDGFPQLLSRYMRRIRASAADVGAEIGLSRESVNNWRNGDAQPARKARDKVLACARYLRLTESETNGLLQAADFAPEFAVEHVAAMASVSSDAPPSVRRVFERLHALRPYPILMLLCPAHLGQPPLRADILAEAQRRFGAEQVLHLQPPYSLAADAAAYFRAVAAQCGLAGVDSDFAFESVLAERLRGSRPLFCLVSRFEQGDPQQRECLAGILRSLSEMHSGRLYLLICGGAALADLKYRGGDLSLLNIALAERWPEAVVTDLLPHAAALGLDALAAERALVASGGHPLLIDAALALLAAEPRRDLDALEAELARHPSLQQSFQPLLVDAAMRGALALALDRDRLAAVRPWIAVPLLRALYWSNLIVERGADGERHYAWRCAAIRRAGIDLLRHHVDP